jgi:hypothetical protein
MNWKLFEKEKPEDGEYILYGNHRAVESTKYHPSNGFDPEAQLLNYKPVIYWCYIEMPPALDREQM